MRRTILKSLYKMSPFDLRGDCLVPPARDDIVVSCVINFYGRLDLLSGILHSLAQQDYPRERFEVVLVEDRGGTPEGRAMAEEFSATLPIVYLPLDKNHGLMGYSRNFGLQHSRGEYVLFLDDDTVLLQQDFLPRLEEQFAAQPKADAIVPHGQASFGVVAERYDFHDPYFMTSRCTAYRRDVLAELGGFMSHFVGQEDVEFVTRFTIARKRAERCAALEYYHPPLLVPNSNKAKAVGASFYQLKGRYPSLVWLLVLVNCSRHAPLMYLPARHHKEMGRFGWGVLLGVWECMSGNKDFQYS